jgi:hypothetical protein
MASKDDKEHILADPARLSENIDEVTTQMKANFMLVMTELIGEMDLEALCELRWTYSSFIQIIDLEIARRMGNKVFN